MTMDYPSYALLYSLPNKTYTYTGPFKYSNNSMKDISLRCVYQTYIDK